jgi:hypothetical protein
MKNGSSEHIEAIVTMKTRLGGLSVETLQEVARQTFADDRDGAEVIMSHALAILERRMPEPAFVAFCKTIA